MSYISLVSLALAMLVLAASPGPGTFATVARALASGFRPALAVICGIVLGDIIFLMFAVFGLSVVAKAMGELFIFVKICGGVYLIWLGLKIWLSKSSAVEPGQARANPSRSGNFIGGLLITLSNPKVILFYCGFLPTFMDLSSLTAIDITLVAGIVTLVLATVLTTYAYLAGQARKLFSSETAVKRLNRTAGGVMIATGVAIAVKS
ncbi:MAG: LysE family translocator [Desulfobacteraceae bacterium]|nr:LysE family translocator [Desulfobacteraceae bacterium]